MFQFYAEDAARLAGDRDLTKVRALHPDLQSFDTWLALHKDEVGASQN